MPDFLMKLVLAEPKYLKGPIAIASELVNEVTFKVNSDGLEMVAMDPANVAMVVLKILSSSFVEFNVPNGTEEFSISLANLKQILRRAKGDDVLTLETGEENQLKVILKGKSARSFTIALLELDEREQKVPDLNFPCNITMPAAQLTDAIEDVSVVAESVTFLGDKESLLIKAKGDLSGALVEIKQDENTKITTTGEDPENSKFKAKYSLEYLKKMMGGSKIGSNVSLSFNNDYPLKLEYKEVDKLAMSFILAPRVDND